MLNLDGPGLGKDALVDGVWFRGISTKDETGNVVGIDLKMTLADPQVNKRFANTVQRLMEPHKTAARLDVLPLDIVLDVNRRAVCEEIVRDWSGVGNSASASIPCTPDNVEKLFKKFPELYDQAIALAKSASNLRRAEMEQSGKNSQPASGTV